MKRHRIYVSGPMTGLPDLNFPAFNLAATHLRDAGFDVVNPAEFDQGPNPTWEACMRTDIKALMDCDGVAFLPGWFSSRGAVVEIYNATALKMQVLSVDEWLRTSAALLQAAA